MKPIGSRGNARAQAEEETVNLCRMRSCPSQRHSIRSYLTRRPQLPRKQDEPECEWGYRQILSTRTFKPHLGQSNPDDR